MGQTGHAEFIRLIPCYDCGMLGGLVEVEVRILDAFNEFGYLTRSLIYNGIISCISLKLQHLLWRDKEKPKLHAYGNFKNTFYVWDLVINWTIENLMKRQYLRNLRSF